LAHTEKGSEASTRFDEAVALSDGEGDDFRNENPADWEKTDD
jgi:hypothetical protein